STEIIVLVGPQASGKSTVATQWANEHDYAIVSQDILKTWQNCVKSADSALREGRSVIVDNTNRDPETRKRYVDLARSLKVHCRCFVMQCSPEHARHNNVFRQIVSPDDEKHKIPDNVIRMFFAGYKPPTPQEGFDETVRVNFVPSFRNDEERKIYLMRLAEK
ncbi:Protein F21D5.5, partial [Aphelenchoides avenae]